jgi:hypothetical protein
VELTLAKAEESYVDPDRYQPHEVLDKYATKLAPNKLHLMQHGRVLSRDRSRAIFMIVAALHDAGAATDEVATIVWNSPYFLDKYGTNRRALGVEVFRIVNKLGAQK